MTAQPAKESAEEINDDLHALARALFHPADTNEETS